jgi:hypothetical protein
VALHMHGDDVVRSNMHTHHMELHTRREEACGEDRA